jgi:glutathione S-transferase
MSCGVRIKLNEYPAALERDTARLSVLWNEGLSRFGGPFLGGKVFTAVDAFFAPVAFRIQSYGLTLDPAAVAYADRLLGTRALREWYAAALKETLRDQAHDEEVSQVGRVVEDLRAT